MQTFSTTVTEWQWMGWLILIGVSLAVAQWKGWLDGIFGPQPQPVRRPAPTAPSAVPPPAPSFADFLRPAAYAQPQSLEDRKLAAAAAMKAVLAEERQRKRDLADVAKIEKGLFDEAPEAVIVPK